MQAGGVFTDRTKVTFVLNLQKEAVAKGQFHELREQSSAGQLLGLHA